MSLTLKTMLHDPGIWLLVALAAGVGLAIWSALHGSLQARELKPWEWWRYPIEESRAHKVRTKGRSASARG